MRELLFTDIPPMYMIWEPGSRNLVQTINWVTKSQLLEQLLYFPDSELAASWKQEPESGIKLGYPKVEYSFPTDNHSVKSLPNTTDDTLQGVNICLLWSNRCKFQYFTISNNELAILHHGASPKYKNSVKEPLLSRKQPFWKTLCLKQCNQQHGGNCDAQRNSLEAFTKEVMFYFSPKKKH